MALTGTLGQFGDEDTWKARYQNEVVKTLESGGGEIFGIPIPIPMPLQEIQAEQAEAIKERIGKEDEPFPVMTGGLVGAIDAIDKMLPPGPNSGIQDPTIPITPVIEPFLNILVDVGIPDPISWILENLEDFNNLPWDKLAECENQEFADSLVEIDSSISSNGLSEKLESVCGFEMPTIEVEFPPKVELPTLDFDFALNLDLPTFDPFINFNPQFPSINWIPIQIMLGIIDALIALIQEIAQLVIEFIKGIINFIIYIIEFVINAIIAAIQFILSILGGAILLIASLIAFIKIVVIAFVTAFVGFMINKGIISFGVGGLLGLE